MPIKISRHRREKDPKPGLQVTLRSPLPGKKHESNRQKIIWPSRPIFLNKRVSRWPRQKTPLKLSPAFFDSSFGFFSLRLFGVLLAQACHILRVRDRLWKSIIPPTSDAPPPGV
jgi:hypothetical protein